jgi:hypothetical protein
VVQESDGVACDQASKRISSDAELLDFVTVFPELLKPCLDLVRDSLAAYFGTIVREAASIALWDEDVEVRVPLANASGEVLEVVWLAPKTARCQGGALAFAWQEARSLTYPCTRTTRCVTFRSVLVGGEVAIAGCSVCGRVGSYTGRGEVEVIVADMLPRWSGKAVLSDGARNALAITLTFALGERDR